MKFLHLCRFSCLDHADYVTALLFFPSLFLLLPSVQTDLMDLLGSDLPIESGEGMKFAWSDGILLQVGILV